MPNREPTGKHALGGRLPTDQVTAILVAVGREESCHPMAPTADTKDARSLLSRTPPGVRFSLLLGRPSAPPRGGRASVFPGARTGLSTKTTAGSAGAPSTAPAATAIVSESTSDSASGYTRSPVGTVPTEFPPKPLE